MPEESFRIHGISSEEVRGKPTFGEEWAAMSNGMGTRPLVVAHNASFDRRFVEMEIREMGGAVPDWEWVCSKEVAMRVWPGQKRYGLAALMQMIGVSEFGHHRASADVEALAVVLDAAREVLGGPEELLKELEKDGKRDVRQTKGWIGRTKCRDEFGVSDEELESLPFEMRSLYGKEYKAWSREDLTWLIAEKASVGTVTKGSDQATAVVETVAVQTVGSAGSGAERPVKVSTANVAAQPASEQAVNADVAERATQPNPYGWIGRTKCRDQYGVSDDDLDSLPSEVRTYNNIEYTAWSREDLSQFVSKKSPAAAAGRPAQSSSSVNGMERVVKPSSYGWIGRRKCKDEFDISDEDLESLPSEYRSYNDVEYQAWSRDVVAQFTGKGSTAGRAEQRSAVGKSKKLPLFGFIGRRRAMEEYGLSEEDLETLPSETRSYNEIDFQAWARKDLARKAGHDLSTASTSSMPSSAQPLTYGWIGRRRAKEEFGVSDEDLEKLTSERRFYNDTEYEAWSRVDLARLRSGSSSSPVSSSSGQQSAPVQLPTTGWIGKTKAMDQYGVDDSDLLTLPSEKRIYLDKEFTAYAREDLARLSLKKSSSSERKDDSHSSSSAGDGNKTSAESSGSGEPSGSADVFEYAFIGRRQAKKEYGVSDADLESLPVHMKGYSGGEFQTWSREDLAFKSGLP